MSITKGEQLFNCETCVKFFSHDRNGSCAPCGENFEGQVLSAYCKVGCGHCLYHLNCNEFWNNGGFGNQQICHRFKLDPELDP